jgi:hypothetical protein
LRAELFCSSRDCCFGSSSAPAQHCGPGLVGHYVLPPEWPTSHFIFTELREVGPGHPVQRLCGQPSPSVAPPGVFEDTNMQGGQALQVRRAAWLGAGGPPRRYPHYDAATTATQPFGGTGITREVQQGGWTAERPQGLDTCPNFRGVFEDAATHPPTHNVVAEVLESTGFCAAARKTFQKQYSPKRNSASGVRLGAWRKYPATTLSRCAVRAPFQGTLTTTSRGHRLMHPLMHRLRHLDFGSDRWDPGDAGGRGGGCIGSHRATG